MRNIVYTGYASPAGADNGRCFAASFDLRWNPSLITAARMGLSLTPRPLNCIVADVGAHAQENCCAHGPELDPTPPQIANALYIHNTISAQTKVYRHAFLLKFKARLFLHL